MIYDAIIIGGGPAGASAAIYLKRAGFNPLIITLQNSSLRKNHHIDNYYGFPSGIDADELFQNGLLQAKNLGIEIKEEEVLDLDFLNENIFCVTTIKATYQAKYIVLATGLSRNIPNIKGLKEYEGKGISYCATCDGFFYRQKKVCIIGNSNYAYLEAKALLPLAKSITILTNGRKLEFRDEAFEYDLREIKSISGEQEKEITFKDDSKLVCDGIFIAAGNASSFTFAKKLGIELKNNQLVVDQNMMTNIDKIYAAGDATRGMLQVSKAVYQGSLAGDVIAKRLQD